MNTTHSLENNSISTNTTTSCDEAPIMPLLSMLFRLKHKRRYELENKSSNSSNYLPDQTILTNKINEAEVCLKQALKKYSS